MITVKRLSSGYYFVGGDGPCNWAQPPSWPCDEATLRTHAHPGAGSAFLNKARDRAEKDYIRARAVAAVDQCGACGNPEGLESP
jgi:hypothetical protein